MLLLAITLIKMKNLYGGVLQQHLPDIHLLVLDL